MRQPLASFMIMTTGLALVACAATRTNEAGVAPVFVLGVVDASKASASPVQAASSAPTPAAAATPSAAPTTSTPTGTATPTASPSPGLASPAPVQTIVVAGALDAADVDGPGSVARFDGPMGLVFAPDQSLLMGDRQNHTLRRVLFANDGSASVSTVAGDGLSGYEDGAALTAEMEEPTGLAIDARGTLFIADPFNHVIRRLSADAATLSTLAGTQAVGSVDGAPLDARFSSPYGLALDARSRLFVCDRDGQTIRMLTLDPTTSQARSVTTVAGTGGLAGSADGVGPAAGFGNPVALAVDPRVTDHTVLYVAEETDCRLRRIDVDANGQGTVTTLNAAAGRCGFDDGPLTDARFNAPQALLVDPARGILISDASNAALRLVSGSTALVVSTLWGPANGLTGPQGLALASDGSLLLADGNTLRRVPR